MDVNLFSAAKACLDACRVEEKLEMVSKLQERWEAGELDLSSTDKPDVAVEAGRPAQPELVPPRSLPPRHFGTVEGHAALIHSITHIEFNAINLALDAIYRFRGLPRNYYDDWITVAADEVHHFTLLRNHLRSLNYDYGDFPAHSGLWEMAKTTAHDVLVRMALVPRLLEARGLDVSPAIMQRLARYGDQQAVRILRVILRDEVNHVEIGNRWYHFLCQQREIDSLKTFGNLIRRYARNAVKGPFNRPARLEAGFAEAEMALLTEFAT